MCTSAAVTTGRHTNQRKVRSGLVTPRTFPAGLYLIGTSILSNAHLAGGWGCTHYIEPGLGLGLYILH